MKEKNFNEKKIYAIFDDSIGEVYPDTHLFILNSDVKAIYSMIVFAGKLNDTEISIRCLGIINDKNVIIPYEEPEYICCFDNAVEYISSYSDNEMISAGFTHKSFIHHYNIIISNINNFRRSLIREDNERSVTNE